MKRTVLSIFASLALLSTAASAASPEETYVDYYQIIQQGTQMLDQGKPEAAFALFRRAEQGLKQLKQDFPQWNDKIVNFRLTDLADKIKPLAAKYPEPVLTPVVPAAAVPKPKDAAAPMGTGKAATPNATFESQLSMLNDEIIGLRMDRALLEKKLNEALAARPAAADPAELAKADGKIKELQKDNDVLKTTLEQTRRDTSSMVPASVVADTRKQLDSAQDELKKQTKQMASLQKENAAATKLKDENSSLKKELSEASKAAKTVAKLEASNASLKTDIASLKQKNDALESDNKRLGKMAKSDDSGASSLRKELEDANRKLSKQTALESRLDGMQAELKSAQATIASLRKDNEKMEKILTDPGTGTEAASKPGDDSVLRKQLAAAEKKAAEARAIAEKSQSELAKARQEKEAAAKSSDEERKSLEQQLKAAMSASGKSNPRDAARIKELEQDRDKLAKELKAASKELNSRQTRKQLAKVETMADELATLKARLEVLEAKPVPYSKEELALFARANTAPSAPATVAKVTSQELPDAARPLIAEAQRDFASRHFADAERKYKQVLEKNDSHVYTLANLAAAQIEQGDLSGADKNLEKALSIAPDDAFALSQMGYLRLRQKKHDEALDFLGRAALKDPKDAVVQNYLGIVLSEKGQRAAAEAALRKAVQLSPGYAEAHNNLAVIYATQKPPMTELARWHYQKARAAGQPANPDLEKMLDGK